MSFEELHFRETLESREIFRNFRSTLVRLNIWKDPIGRVITHEYCLKCALPFKKKSRAKS